MASLYHINKEMGIDEIKNMQNRKILPDTVGVRQAIGIKAYMRRKTQKRNCIVPAQCIFLSTGAASFLLVLRNSEMT